MNHMCWEEEEFCKIATEPKPLESAIGSGQRHHGYVVKETKATATACAEQREFNN